jgi:putative oxidoreductase
MIRIPRAAMWTCAAFLAAAFVLVGFSKLGGPSALRWADRFAHWGYPAPVRYVIGILEIVGGVGLLIAKARRAAAATLVALMIGAVFTHIVSAEPMRLLPPLVLGGLGFLVYSWRP